MEIPNHFALGRCSRRVFERNKTIVRMRSKGESLRSIGSVVDLSAERVRQVLERTKRTVRDRIENNNGLNGLTTRTQNCILNSIYDGIYASGRGQRTISISEIKEHWPFDDVPNFGRKSKEELACWLKQRGVSVVLG
jgi:hypothetical protein